VKLGNVGLIVSARTRSTRLPGKALLPLRGMPMILYLLRRLSPFAAGTVVLATTNLESDDRLADVVSKSGAEVYRGDENDLVARYVGAAEQYGFDTVVRATGDCPFIDAEFVTWCLGQAESLDAFDLATTKGLFPVGLDAEIYRAEVMTRLHKTDRLSAAQREHLTLFIYDHEDEFVVRRLQPRPAWAGCGNTFTVDTAADYEAACERAERFSSPMFSIAALIESEGMRGRRDAAELRE